MVKTAISGYVYSKDMKEFVEQAYVKIVDKDLKTDKNGYFNAVIESGRYTAQALFLNKRKWIKGLHAVLYLVMFNFFVIQTTSF